MIKKNKAFLLLVFCFPFTVLLLNAINDFVKYKLAVIYLPVVQL